MIRALVVALLLLAPASASAWETPFKSGLALELGGEGLTASLHYENLVLATGGRHRLLARAGLGWAPLFTNGAPTAGNFVVPVGGRYLYGFGAHHLELGLAVPLRFRAAELPVGRTDERLSLSLVPSVGYRYENFEGGRFFGDVAYSPRLAQSVLGLAYMHFVRVGGGVRF